MRYLITIVLYFLVGSSSFLYGQNKVEKTVIKGKVFTGQLNASGFYLTDSKKDTILKLTEDSYFSFEFRDFNSDGFKDIFLEWGGNTPEIYTVYQFIPLTKSFRLIRNSNDFPAAKRIRGTKFYYSYARNGCADNTWNSDLFYIKDYTAIRLGHIHREGCGVNDGIYVYRTNRTSNQLYKTFSLDTLSKFKNNKWGFIEDYWTKSYHQFL
jgi:hypothetical protein